MDSVLNRQMAQEVPIQSCEKEKIKMPFCFFHRSHEALKFAYYHEDEFYFVCKSCANELAKDSTQISLSSIFSEDENHVCPTWPPVQNKKIYLEYIKEFKDDDMIEQIETSFTYLQDTLNQKLAEKKQESLKLAQDLFKFKQDFKQKYKDLSKMDELRQLVIDYVSTKDISNLKEYIKEKERQSLTNTEIIEENLKTYQQLRSKFYLADLKTFSTNLINKVDNFIVFPQVEKKVAQEVSELQLLLNKLLSNRSNFVTQQFMSEFNEAYEEVAYIFESTIQKKTILQEHSYPLPFHKLKDNEFNAIQQMTKRFVNPTELDYKSRQVNQILSLVNNKFNQLNKQFVQDLQNALIRVEPIFSELNFSHDYLFERRPDPSILNYLQDAQVENIIKMIQCMLKYMSKGNTYNIREREISNIVYINLAPICSNKEKLKNLLLQFPIFEFMSRQELQELSIMPQIYGTLLKCSYNDSSKIAIEQRGNERIQIQNYSNAFGGVYFNYDLEPDKKYVMRFRFDNEVSNFLIIGVVPKEQAAVAQLGNTFQGKILGTDSNNYCSEVIQGKKLNLEMKQSTTLEMRVDISKRSLVFCDYPDYKNFNQLEKHHQLNPDQIYNLAIQFGYSVPYSSSINLIYFQQVEQFEYSIN